MRRLLSFVIATFVIVTSPVNAIAQDPATEIAELRARLDALERRNWELENRLHRLPDVTTVAATNDTYLREMAVREAVENYLAQKAAAEQKSTVVGSDLSMSANWKDGLEVSTKLKDFRVHVGGRTQFDAAWFDTPANLQAPPATTGLGNLYGDGVDLRRARLRVDGTMYQVIDWAAEYDFVNAVRVRNSNNTGTVDHTVPAFTDLWVTIKELPAIGNVRIGNQKEPIGFEHLVSSRFLPFMERSFNQDTFYGGFYNGFTPGIQAFNQTPNDQGSWAIGLFKPTDNVFAYNTNDGDYAVTGRVTYLPWYFDEGRSLLHVGLSVRQASTIGDRQRFRTRSPVRSGIASTWPIPADTGTLAGEDMLWINAEIAAVLGPWTLQAEYLNSYLQDAAAIVGGVVQPSVGTVHYEGGYVQVMYFVTGENDKYSKERAAFDRVKPFENFFLVRGCDGGNLFGRGAWQIGARYNYLDLNDKGLNGGILHDGTFGVNWFLNPNMKIQGNYSMTYRDSPIAAADGWIHGWGMRVAHDF